MRLGTLRSANSLDGELVVLHRQQPKMARVANGSLSLRAALENWKRHEPLLKKISEDLNGGTITGEAMPAAQDFLSCLPRSFLFADGSAFINHIKLVRKARNAEPPTTLTSVPLMYQGESARFASPTEAIPFVDPKFGTDFEAEVGVITDFVPRGVTPEKALSHIQLFCLINDVSLRGLIPEELAAGFGFFQSKPASALTPFAVTADELGAAWKGGRVHLPIQVQLNKIPFGSPNAGEMHFHFGDLIAHAARTRDLAPGTLIGSGTVSNENSAVGCGCLAEKRTLEQIQSGAPATPFMKPGDEVEIRMADAAGRDLFGAILQRVQG